MTKRGFGLAVVTLSIGLLAPAVYACWDNSDLFVAKLKKVDLTTEQLKELFDLREQHKAVVVRAHTENLGCSYHENHEKVFEKQAVGVLNDKQFEKAVGRKRTEVESLTYENKELKKRLAEMEKRLALLEAALKAAEAAKTK
jgi:predicted RNase H-like nuclease (RuvC/YqgF family)